MIPYWGESEHHDKHHQYLNGNYATTFTFWDDFFKTKLINEKHTILLVNDDGIFSPGLRFLIKICKKIGKVLVVASEQNQSGMSHAITVDKEIKINKLESSKNYEEYSCSGTPVDCVKIATKKILKEKPDLCISGINHGSNYSISTLYSATLHAAIEGAIGGIPSIAISHLDILPKLIFHPMINF